MNIINKLLAGLLIIVFLHLDNFIKNLHIQSIFSNFIINDTFDFIFFSYVFMFLFFILQNFIKNWNLIVFFIIYIFWISLLLEISFILGGVFFPEKYVMCCCENSILESGFYIKIFLSSLWWSFILFIIALLSFLSILMYKKHLYYYILFSIQILIYFFLRINFLYNMDFFMDLPFIIFIIMIFNIKVIYFKKFIFYLIPIIYLINFLIIFYLNMYSSLYVEFPNFLNKTLLIMYLPIIFKKILNCSKLNEISYYN